MGNHKTGKNLVCPQCNKIFYIIASRLALHRNHYCSVKCLSRYTAKLRSIKLRKKDYPFVFDSPCLYCGGEIIIKNASFDKTDRKFCSLSCKTSFQNQRTIYTEERRKQLSLRIKKLWKSDLFREQMSSESRRINSSNAIKGRKHWNWQGGITAESFKERNNPQLKEWTRKVFQRDNYTCSNCGARNGQGIRVVLAAHHIKRWSKYKELRYELSNGLTLCEPCHAKTDNYKGKGTIRSDIHKSITQYSLLNEKIRDWESIEMAAKNLAILNTSIGNCLKLRTKSAGGFKWQYKNR
ncbi:MAG: HNH endonuclease [Candidatus Levybacteria bacterium]|nr:HNH endonuclease [Candidatus Levybacteria bacterium]